MAHDFELETAARGERSLPGHADTAGATRGARLRDAEFVALAALSTSLVAMSTDAMLPALGTIATELGALTDNGRQQVIAVFFAGLGLGQLLAGPLSDALGRRRTMIAGLTLFVLASAASTQVHDMRTLIAARALMGLGAAAPRVLVVAMLRDLYEGAAMARIMSFVSAVFMVVPALAPSLGQWVSDACGWRAIFVALTAVGVLNLAWFTLRQPETLPAALRTRLTVRSLVAAARAVSRERGSLADTVLAGVLFGAFITYLSTAQQVFFELYGLGASFPFAFGGLALVLGASSLVNASRVRAVGVTPLITRSLWGVLLAAGALLACAQSWGGVPPLALYLAGIGLMFFAYAPLYGNLSARAMAPLSREAGLGAALTGALTTLLGFVVSALFGALYCGAVWPIALAFGSAAALGLVLDRCVTDAGRLTVRARSGSGSLPRRRTRPR